MPQVHELWLYLWQVHLPHEHVQDGVHWLLQDGHHVHVRQERRQDEVHELQQDWHEVHVPL